MQRKMSDEKTIIIWIGEEKKKPPMLYEVWVMNGKRKMLAYWCPTMGWQMEDGYNAKKLHKVTKWAEIPDWTFKNQKDEHLEYLERRDVSEGSY